MTRALAFLVVAAALLVGAGPGSTRAAKGPIVVVVRHGGLCMAGPECRFVLRITDRAISNGYRSRPLSASERRSLLRAIGELDAGYLRRHPFKGMCPMAYDGQESIYRFRGLAPSVPSCTYDVRGIRAVRLAERLLATLG